MKTTLDDANILTNTTDSRNANYSDKTDKPTKLDKQALLSALKKDFSASTTFRDAENTNIQNRIDAVEGALFGNEEKGKSRIVTKDIKKQYEWLLPVLIEPFTALPEIVNFTPITEEDVESAKQNSILLNNQFCRQFDRFNFISNTIRVLLREATCVIQTGWCYEDRKVKKEGLVVVKDENGIERLSVSEIEDIEVVTNKPTAKLCRNEDIFIDPTCMGDMSNCQFIIYRYETDLTTLKQDGRYSNLDKIIPDNEDSESDSDFVPERADNSTFKFSDDPRKKILVHEYWGNYDINGDGIAEPIVCAWVGNTIIRLCENPYPDKELPFIVVPYSPIPFKNFGETYSDFIDDNQKVKSLITRGIIDNIARSNNGQVGVQTGSLEPSDLKKFIAGKNFQYNGVKPGIWQGNFNEIPGSAFSTINMQNNEIESMTGVKTFNTGITGNSLGSTATGVQSAVNATSGRQMLSIKNIAENLIKNLIRKWMAYNSELLSEEEVVRHTNGEFVTIRKDDIKGNIDLEITIRTKDDDAAKARDLVFLLQTMGPSASFDIKKSILAKIYELKREPAEAKKMLALEEPRDPIAEDVRKEGLTKLKLENEKLALENKKLEAEIVKTYSTAADVKIESLNKKAKTRVELAKARKLESEADIRDIDFMRKDNQIDHKEKLEIAEQNRLANMDALAFQAMQGDKNLGTIS